MTTAAEHHDAQLAAIKQRHDAWRSRINDPEARVGDRVLVSGGPTMRQLGLCEVFADALGRLWVPRDDQQDLVMIVDPTRDAREAR